MTTWLLSDSGILAIYRMIGGFGINTYKGINADGHAVYIKYH
jgi:catalase